MKVLKNDNLDKSISQIFTTKAIRYLFHDKIQFIYLLYNISVWIQKMKRRNKFYSMLPSDCNEKSLDIVILGPTIKAINST